LVYVCCPRMTDLPYTTLIHCVDLERAAANKVDELRFHQRAWSYVDPVGSTRLIPVIAFTLGTHDRHSAGHGDGRTECRRVRDRLVDVMDARPVAGDVAQEAHPARASRVADDQGTALGGNAPPEAFARSASNLL